MTDTQTVFKLRKEGKLKEALKISRDIIKEAPHDEWTIRAFGWTLISVIDEYVKGNKIKVIEEIEQLKVELANLEIDKSDEILYNRRIRTLALCSRFGKKIQEAALLSKNENKHEKAKNILLSILHEEPNNQEALKTVCWVIYRQLKTKNIDCDALLNEVKAHYLKIENGDDFLLRYITIASSIISAQCLTYPDFIKECIIPNISTEPVREQSRDEEIKPSSAEIVLKGLYKHLKKNKDNRVTVSIWFSDILEKWENIELVDKKWSPYYHGRLYSWCTDNKGIALKYLLPIARNKNNEFWIWDALADCMDTDEMRIACYCRSMESNYADETFMKNIYIELATLWDINGNKAVSSYIASKANDIIEIKNQVIPEELQYIVEADWYNPSKLNKTEFQKIVKENSNKANDLLISDLPIYPSNFIAESNNAEKGLYYSDFALEDGNTALIRTSDSLNLVPGSNCNIKYQLTNTNKRQVLWWEKRVGPKWDIVELKPAMVVYTNKKKGFLLAAISKDFNTILYYDKFLEIEELVVGDIILVRTLKNGKGKYFTVDWQNTSSKIDIDFIRPFKGQFTFADGSRFGFINHDYIEIFISPDFTEEFNDYDLLEGTAIYQKKKKGGYRWKALCIDRHVPYQEDTASIDDILDNE